MSKCKTDKECSDDKICTINSTNRCVLKLGTTGLNEQKQRGTKPVIKPIINPVTKDKYISKPAKPITKNTTTIRYKDISNVLTNINMELDHITI